jgi:hypothetical protein
MSKHKNDFMLDPEIYPRNGLLEPVFIDGFAYGLSPYPIVEGELMYACQRHYDNDGTEAQRFYYVGICKGRLSNGMIRFSTIPMPNTGYSSQVVEVPIEVCARLTHIIPVITPKEERLEGTVPSIEVIKTYN